MNKKLIGMFAVGMFFLIALAGFGSAYYYGGYFDSYYGQGNYDSYHSYTARTSGYGPFLTTKSTQYDKTTESYWNGYSWVDRTVYVRETKETPSYYAYAPRYNYRAYSYPDYSYRNYDYGYGRYY